VQIYQHFLRPILFQMDPEHAHHLTMRMAQTMGNWAVTRQFVSQAYNWQSPLLNQKIAGLSYRNPVGLAAGFDKNAELPRLLEAVGFGFVEVGSITARAATGNPQPRMFRLPDDRSLINRMGLNNEGAESITRRVASLKPKLNIPLGINIAKTNDASIHGDAAVRDYATSLKLALPVADYITINVSCPNTGEGKTFEDPKALEVLLASLRSTIDEYEGKAQPPIFVKLSVDLSESQVKSLADICLRYEMDGFVAVNTSNSRANLQTDKETLDRIGRGGLSGQAIHDRSITIIRMLYDHTKGQKPIIGVGGIDSPDSALETLQAGASLLQIYSGLVYEGPALVKRINQFLAQQVRTQGFSDFPSWLNHLR
jgi:dihydroorotate dehydrogenase